MADDTRLDAVVNQDDFRILSLIRDGKATSPTEVIPDSIDDRPLLDYLGAACRALVKADEISATMKPYIGRICLLLKNRPKLTEALGYKGYDDFMTNGMPAKYHISRPNAYTCANIAAHLGFLPTNTLLELKPEKLRALSNIIKKKTSAPGLTVEMIEKSREYWTNEALEAPTARAFIAAIEERKLADKGELHPRVPIIIHGTTDLKSRWTHFCADPLIQEYCEATFDFEAVILDRLMSECETEWRSQMVDAARTAAMGQAQAG